MTPGILNLRLLTDNPVIVRLLVTDAAGESVDLSTAELRPALALAGESRELVCTVTDAAGGLCEVSIPAQHVGMGNWEFRASLGGVVNRILLKGLVTISDAIQPGEDANPLTETYTLRVSETVKVTINAPDLAYLAQRRAETAAVQAAASAELAGNAETQTGVNLELSDILAQQTSRAAVSASASANSASATLKSAIKTGQLETATLGGGLTVAGEIIAQSPPKSMNAALRLDDTLAGLIMPKKLDVQLDVSRLPMIGTGAKNHYLGIDFGPPSSAQVKGVKIPGLYYQQSWGAAALIIELTQWLGANLYICVRRPPLTDNTPINTMVTEHDRVIDGSAQFAFIARAETQTYDLDCMSQDDTLTQHKPVCSYPSHDGCMRLIVIGRKGSSMIDLYMCNNNDCMFSNSGINYRPRKIGEAALETGEYRIQVLIGMLAGGVLGGAGHAYRYRTPYLSRATWLFGNDITSKIQQLVL